MKTLALLLCLLACGATPPLAQDTRPANKRAARTYLGFDRNVYPGDANLPLLRKTFWYAGYWLNNPPGEKINTWTGKRSLLQSAGFGFLVLFNGRTYAEIRKARAAELGRNDASAAAQAAGKEGFPPGTVIFLDQEEGGRLLPEQRAYLHAWVDRIHEAGFRAGIYCSGMAAREGRRKKVVTARDVRQNAAGREIVYWVSNDACGPSPGCFFPQNPPPPGASGVPFVSVWQFAQSPRRKALTASCARSYHQDGHCYPPGFGPAQRLHVDLNTAMLSDPSHGRTLTK